MVLSYYGLVLLIAFCIASYIAKKRKINESVYHYSEPSDEETADNCDDDEIVQEETQTQTDEDELQDEPYFDCAAYNLIRFWIIQKLDPVYKEYDELEKLLSKTFGTLPDILEDATTCLQKESEVFLQEMLGRVEYSSKFKFLLVTQSRKITALLQNLFRFLGFVFFILFQIEIRKDSSEKDIFYFVSCIVAFVAAALCKKVSDKIFNYMLYRMKPGDYLKILYAPDDFVEKKVKLNQLSKNETIFNTTVKYESKKKLICEKYIELSEDKVNTISSKLCLYLVINYLKSEYSKEAYREYLLEKEIELLEFISAFNQNSVSANYELSLCYFESRRLKDFYNCLLKCRSINGYDWVIESEIKAYEFYIENYPKTYSLNNK